MTDDQMRVVIALIRKLGGEVELTDKDLMDAEDFELQQSQANSFIRGVRYLTRLAPVTVEGELINEIEGQ